MSEADGSFISKSGYQPLSMLLDRNWLSMLPEDMQPGKPVRLYRKVADLYPYVLSYVTRVNSGKNAGYIVVNANIKYFPALTEQSRIQALSSYILTQDGQILYRTMKRDLLEPLETVPELSAFSWRKTLSPAGARRCAVCLFPGLIPRSTSCILSPSRI